MATAKISFKFRGDASRKERERVLEGLSEHWACKVTALFESDPDPDLSSIFLAECENERALSEAVAFLEKSNHIEYAEHEPVRRLIR